jgi:hypothetical protein
MICARGTLVTERKPKFAFFGPEFIKVSYLYSK